jgi:hypothetical protein
MDVKEKSTGPATLDGLVDQLQPKVVRARVLASLDELFREGRTRTHSRRDFCPDAW